MLIPAQSGANEVQIDFVRTWDRTAGGWISLATLTFTILLLVSDSGLRLERKLVSSSK
jgi:hypothetical protein